jgi:asparagine synthase (glutamine-hydrolysing)
MLADDLATEPLRASQSLPWLLRRRASVVASQNYRLLAAEFGVNLVQPLLDPEFVDALAIAAGPLGFASRTEAMRRLAGDLLPEAVLARATKAYFNRAFLGESTREFARAWDGSTLDLDLVDPELLRQEWLSKFPSATSGLLLQAAWLAGAVGDNA